MLLCQEISIGLLTRFINYLAPLSPGNESEVMRRSPFVVAGKISKKVEKIVSIVIDPGQF